jgi:hypothetical protein
MKYCQGPKCHEYKTKDRIKGTKGNKSYQTRRRSSFYYMSGNVCSMNCQHDWFVKFGEQALNHFGRTTEAKKVLCDNAWFKSSKYNYNTNGGSFYDHHLVNDLLGQRIAITEEQYNNCTDNINDLVSQLTK